MTAHVAWIVLAAQLAAAVGHAAPAAPAPPALAPAPPDPAEARALDHLDRGVAAYRAGDYERARAELVAASALAPDKPNPYRWLALSEVALGDCASALIHVESFLSRVAPADPRVAEVVALRERCVDTAVVRVSSTPSGASLRLDGGPPAATTPARLAMRTGHHRIVVEKPGFQSESHDLDVPATGELFQSYTLREPRPPPPLVRRWWFWTAVGAVAITAAGVGYGLSRGPDARLPPVT
ncbi:MAG TPA: PEGA domain-containing protein, partial [Kofleriaceae bacterium]